MNYWNKIRAAVYRQALEESIAGEVPERRLEPTYLRLKREEAKQRAERAAAEILRRAAKRKDGDE